MKGLTIIVPVASPDILFLFIILIFAFIFSFNTFTKPILVELISTFFITSLEFGVNRVRAIKNDAELGSEAMV